MKKYLSLLILLLVFPIASSEVEQYSFDITLAYGKAVVYGTIIQENVSDSIEINLPKNKALSVYVDGKLTKFENDSFFVSGKEIKYNYVTKEFIDNENFVFDFIAPVNISKLRLKLTLPDNVRLAKPVGTTTSAVYPKPKEITTDGQSIILIWEKMNMEKGNEFPIYVRYTQLNYPFWIYFSIIVVVIAAVAITILILKRKTKIITRVKKEDMFEKHLKEDEEQIINVLKMKENKCEQGTLRVITGFSKATLSRILKELEDRKIIYKEKRGRKNLVFLRK